MNTLKKFRRKMWTLGALLALSGGTAQAQPIVIDPPEKNPPAPAPAPMPPAVKPAEEPRYAFEMRDKPWIDVFEWLNDKTKLAIYAIDKPTGTFTYIGAKAVGQPPSYTIPEVIDILNEGL